MTGGSYRDTGYVLMVTCSWAIFFGKALCMAFGRVRFFRIGIATFGLLPATMHASDLLEFPSQRN